MNFRFIAIGLLLAHVAGAQQAPGEVGRTSSALPGIGRVGVVQSSRESIAAGLTLGYGYTEAQSNEDAAHHRLLAVPALALVPAEWLAIGVRADTRYDRHTGDDGWIADPSLQARIGWGAGAFRYGVELGIWLPGSESAGTSLEAVSPSGELLLALTNGDLTLAGNFGFRLDRSGVAGDSAPRLSTEDRLALGLSDSNAVLVGVGTAYALGATELLLEATADILVGDSAPAPVESPLRLAGGARHHFTPALQAQLLAEASLSQRPAFGPTDPLVPIEPRLSVLVGATYAWDLNPPPAQPPKTTPPAVAPPDTSPPPPPADAGKTTLSINVRDAAGNPVTAAEVTLAVGKDVQRASPLEDGVYRFQALPPGDATLTVVAPGADPIKQTVTIGSTPETVSVDLPKPKPVLGQVRGLVRSFKGAAVSAKVTIAAANVEVTTDEEGYFEVDVPPGEYEVVIEASGYRTQRRKLEVQADGVVILNADLYR